MSVDMASGILWVIMGAGALEGGVPGRGRGGHPGMGVGVILWG